MTINVVNSSFTMPMPGTMGDSEEEKLRFFILSIQQLAAHNDGLDENTKKDLALQNIDTDKYIGELLSAAQNLHEQRQYIRSFIQNLHITSHKCAGGYYAECSFMSEKLNVPSRVSHNYSDTSVEPTREAAIAACITRILMQESS